MIFPDTEAIEKPILARRVKICYIISLMIDCIQLTLFISFLFFSCTWTLQLEMYRRVENLLVCFLADRLCSVDDTYRK